MAQDSASVVPFDFEDFEIRVVMIDEEPWWVALDVCRALGIADVADAADRLDPADRVKDRIRSGGQNREVWMINESGLYELIIRSDKPKARKFRRWITSEVLPSIRKTGQYGVAQIQDPALRAIADTLVQLDAVQQEQARLKSEVAELTGEVVEIGARVDGLTQNTGWYTALAWAKANGYRQTSNEHMKRLGRRASKLCREAGITRGDAPNESFYTVKTYPADILQQAADEIGLR